MTHDKFYNLIQFVKSRDTLVPFENYIELLNDLEDGEKIYFEKKKYRDLRLHKCYFDLLSYIWGYLPKSFQSVVPKNKFYKWLQTLKGEYEVLFEFKDGRQLIEYNSISFANMDEFKFRNHIKEQLPYIYENVIRPFYGKLRYDAIIHNIEQKYEKFMVKLYSKETT